MLIREMVSAGPFFNPIPFDAGVLVDIQSNSSYFKFNLDYMTFYTLVRYNPTSSQYLNAYVDVRNYTANHQNPFFDIIDHALRGANHFDTEIVQPLLDQWLLVTQTRSLHRRQQGCADL